jgi:phosphoglycerate dehydrogenase-like enzyme
MRILISDLLAKEAVEILREAGFEVVENPNITPDELRREIANYDALIVRGRTKVTKELIEAGKNLKIIGRAGVGLDNIDLVKAEEKGIKLVYTPQATSISKKVINYLRWELPALMRLRYRKEEPFDDYD